jgi:hypothetical protein
MDDHLGGHHAGWPDLLEADLQGLRRSRRLSISIIGI